MMLQLASTEPFAQGGNRLCYMHPDDPARCVKVRRPDFTLEDRRRKKGFPKNLRPLSWFDDNLEESKVMTSFEKHYGDIGFKYISRCYGFVETDMGKGLVSELIRDGDSRISQTLKKYIWDFDLTDQIEEKIDELAEFWREHRIPSRDLLLHNIVVQQDGAGQIMRLVVIDGLGSAGAIPWCIKPTFVQRRKVESKIRNMYERIESLRSQRGQERFPGYHGLLIHDGIERMAPHDGDQNGL